MSNLLMSFIFQNVGPRGANPGETVVGAAEALKQDDGALITQDDGEQIYVRSSAQEL